MLIKQIPSNLIATPPSFSLKNLIAPPSSHLFIHMAPPYFFPPPPSINNDRSLRLTYIYMYLNILRCKSIIFLCQRWILIKTIKEKLLKKSDRCHACIPQVLNLVTTNSGLRNDIGLLG